jgi:hypothetical protein
MTHSTRTLKHVTRRIAVWALVASTTIAAGCAIPRPLPPYQSSFANQKSLSRLPHGAVYRVETVSEPTTVENKVRAYLITAPGGGSWGSYLHDGIRNELATSGNYNTNATSAINVTLLAVQLDDGHAHVSARFVVKRGTQVRYDKMLHADGRWRTSMLAAVAVPAASQGASVLFQDLLSQFFNDPDFVNSGT